MHIHFFRFYLSFLLFYFFLFFSLFFFFFFLFLFFFFFFFFFLQAEDGIRDGNCDWSSDVCSSDLAHHERHHAQDGNTGNDDLLMFSKTAKRIESHCASSSYGDWPDRPNPPRA